MTQKVHRTDGTGLPTASEAAWPEEFSHQQQLGFPTGTDTPSLGVARKRFIAAIDDSPTVRKIIETCLGREGYVVKSFSDGVEALHWSLQPGALIPALVLLDIGLPKMNGYDVAWIFKARPQFDQTVIVMASCCDGVINRLKGRLVRVKTSSSNH
jgi:twitching motility two-component system response regulator PilG